MRRAVAQRPPVAVDLFSGAGGLSEGLAQAGFEIPVAVELHPQAALTHAFNHPETTVLVGDIHGLSFERIDAVLQTRGCAQADVVVGGPPCQGFSTAGKKEALDPRNNLFREFARFVGHLRPKMFLLENVPGFKKMYDGAAYREALTLLSALGYSTLDTVVDASEFGVPQRRLRFLMVGWLHDSLVTPFEWPQPTHAASTTLWNRDGLARPLVSAREAIGDLAFLAPGWEAHRHQRAPKATYQADRRNECALLFNHLATRHRQRALSMFAHIGPGQTISRVPRRIRSAKRTMARLAPDELSNAVLALPDDLIHYSHDRTLTVREMGRLQSFDDDYVFLGKRTSGFIQRRVDVPQYTQVGNAVPPLLARALGQALATALGTRVHDRRRIDVRRARHQWLRGSSGFSGYRLTAEAMALAIEPIDGSAIGLPLTTDDADLPVALAPRKEEWVLRSRRRGATAATPR